MAYTPPTLVKISNSKTLSANNTTAAVPIFTLTGSVNIFKIYGIVTTVLGSAVTVAYFRLNDSSFQSNITNSTGTTLSSAAVGSLFFKPSTNGTALTLLASSAERIAETAANHPNFQEILLTANNGATTNIEFVYTTTNTPTSGAITFYAEYQPIGTGALATI